MGAGIFFVVLHFYLFVLFVISVIASIICYFLFIFSKISTSPQLRFALRHFLAWIFLDLPISFILAFYFISNPTLIQGVVSVVIFAAIKLFFYYVIMFLKFKKGQERWGIVIAGLVQLAACFVFVLVFIPKLFSIEKNESIYSNVTASNGAYYIVKSGDGVYRSQDFLNWQKLHDVPRSFIAPHLFMTGSDIFVSSDSREKKIVADDYKGILMHVTSSGFQSVELPYGVYKESLGVCEGTLYGLHTDYGLDSLDYRGALYEFEKMSWKNLGGFLSMPVVCGGKEWILDNFGGGAALHLFDRKTPDHYGFPIWTSVAVGGGTIVATDRNGIFRFESGSWKSIKEAVPGPVIEILPSQNEIVIVTKTGVIASFQNNKWVTQAVLDEDKFDRVWTGQVKKVDDVFFAEGRNNQLYVWTKKAWVPVLYQNDPVYGGNMTQVDNQMSIDLYKRAGDQKEYGFLTFNGSKWVKDYEMTGYDLDGVPCFRKGEYPNRVLYCGSKEIEQDDIQYLYKDSKHLVSDEDFIYGMRLRERCELERFDKAMGKSLGEMTLDGVVNCTDLLFNGKYYVVGSNGVVYRLENGKFQIIKNPDIPSLLPPSAELKCADDKLYASVGRRSLGLDGFEGPNFYAHDDSSWRFLWGVPQGREFDSPEKLGEYYFIQKTGEVVTNKGKLYLSLVSTNGIDKLVSSDGPPFGDFKPVGLPVEDAITSMIAKDGALFVSFRKNGIYKLTDGNWSAVPISSAVH